VQTITDGNGDVELRGLANRKAGMVNIATNPSAETNIHDGESVVNQPASPPANNATNTVQASRTALPATEVCLRAAPIARSTATIP